MKQDVTASRESRIATLTEQADRCSEQAQALEALAEMIVEQAIPQSSGRFAPYWTSVAERLRADAATAHAVERRIQSRISDVAAAQEARERWIPTRAK